MRLFGFSKFTEIGNLAWLILIKTFLLIVLQTKQARSFYLLI